MVNSQELNKAISELEIQVKKFRSISEVYSELSVFKTELAKLKAQDSISADKIKNITEKLDGKLATYEKLFSDLVKSNKSYQLELEQHINSKLDKHKADLQIVIQAEGAQIQRGFENSLTLNFNNLQSKIQENYYKQEKKIDLLKILLLVVIILCSVLALLLILK